MLCRVIPFADTMCFKQIKDIEENLHELEADNNEDQTYSSDEEETDVDPAYLVYLHETYHELYNFVEDAGGELTLHVYTRFLLDELYIGRYISPYWFNHGLDLIYEE